ncbi:PAS domain S-box protein [Virgibacillus sp. C22-A2]|uniref:PAS domain S-box protein n=1 Tax=Virgibacillus tibetensis TaxID=3042313 RepID=A0ABU6KKR3_9BACI|nr:PAS domain S-box protein [Virgibacillus sp. C22-A2]
MEQSPTGIDKETMYQQIVEYSFETTVIHSDHKVLYINQSGAEFLGANKEDIIGTNILDVFTDKDRDFLVERIRQGTIENKIGELIEITVKKADGTLVDVELYCHPVEFGETKAMQSILRDITPQRKAEKRLRQVIREVATPIVPVHEGISVLPLVGELDSDRIEQLLNIIPQKILDHDLDYLIIDISGAYNIDTHVVEFLYKINAIIGMLGITLIFTGIRPELTKAAVEVCINIDTLRTMSTVKQALNHLVKK